MEKENVFMDTARMHGDWGYFTKSIFSSNTSWNLVFHRSTFLAMSSLIFPL